MAGRLVGLAVGVGLLALSVWFALHVLDVLIPMVVPLIGVLLIYTVMFGRHRRK